MVSENQAYGCRTSLAEETCSSCLGGATGGMMAPLASHGYHSFDIKYCRLLHWGGQRLQNAVDKGAPPGVFLGRGAFRVAERMMKTPATDNAIRSYARRHRIQAGG